MKSCVFYFKTNPDNTYELINCDAAKKKHDKNKLRAGSMASKGAVARISPVFGLDCRSSHRLVNIKKDAPEKPW